MESILEIKGLKKSFKDFSLKGIDITLEKGYIMGFIGPRLRRHYNKTFMNLEKGSYQSIRLG